MQAIFWTLEEVAERAKKFYENGIRQQVEFGDNIGKMIVIDAETGEYGIDKSGVETAVIPFTKNYATVGAQCLRPKNPRNCSNNF